MLRASRRRVVNRLLPWAPPTLTSPRLITITDFQTVRRITLNAGEDCLITAPRIVTGFDYNFDTADALVHVTGGRNVVWIGGHIRAQAEPVTVLADYVDDKARVIPVVSTIGYPPVGMLRIDGEQIRYNSKSLTGFNVNGRNFGFFNTSPVSKLTHTPGTPVYPGEATRSGVSFTGQTGTVHLEGIRMDGALGDGVRVSQQVNTLTMQNMRIGPVTNFDNVYQTDGHPDAVQAYNRGAVNIKIARSTLIAGLSGRCILNAASDSGTGTIVNKITLRDVEFVDQSARELINNADAGTTWDVANAWLRSPRLTRAGLVVGTTAFASSFGMAPLDDSAPDFAPESTVGLGYVSPGYL